MNNDPSLRGGRGIKAAYYIEENRILFADEECLVINKLPGESSEAREIPGMVSLPQVLADQFGAVKIREPGGGPFFPAAVHRLDVPVSGCILFARTPGSLAALSATFAQGRAEKTYWAVIEMPASPAELGEGGELVHWIKTDTRRNKSTAYNEAGPGRKKAVLHYRVRGRGIHYLFLEITLFTGRHHQIRAQLAARGLHIKGDLKYGGRRSEKNGGIRLHAFSLAFPHPARPGETVRLQGEPPLPDPLWEAFKQC
ncbi:MAG: RNA pseudouridine synthase [Treponema sp.]|nr:RNA pseudouridine synthase [Treponema sp.]